MKRETQSKNGKEALVLDLELASWMPGSPPLMNKNSVVSEGSKQLQALAISFFILG